MQHKFRSQFDDVNDSRVAKDALFPFPVFCAINDASLFKESKLSGTNSSSATEILYFSCTNDTSSRTPVESIIPFSRNETSSPNVSSSSPYKKLSVMNFLISGLHCIISSPHYLSRYCTG